MKIILTRKFIKYFLISFSIFMGLLLLQYLSMYADDIFNKGFPTRDVLNLIYYTSTTLFGFSLLFGVLIASIFSFRYYSNCQVIEFKKELISGALMMVSISLVFFGFNNWILPKQKIEMRSLLYEMQRTASGEEIQHVDKDLFKKYHSTLTIKDINLQIDTFDIQINEYKHQCDSVLAILPDSIASEQYDKLGLENYGIKYKSIINDTITGRKVRFASNYLRKCQRNLQKSINKKMKYVKERTSRIVLSIELLLLFLIGASFGFYYNDQKTFLLVVLGLYTTSFFYGTIIGFERLISNNFLGNTKGTISSMIILLILTLIFLIKGVKKGHQITQPNRVEGSPTNRSQYASHPPKQ